MSALRWIWARVSTAIAYLLLALGNRVPEPPALRSLPPLDERDVDLWAQQILTADADRIIREASR